jgi:formylglycine-generating enzyme
MKLRFDRRLLSLTSARIATLGAAACGVGLAYLGQSSEAADAPQTNAQPTEFKSFTQNLPGTDVKFEMLPIPGGKFMLGSPETEKRRKNDEGPQVEVTIEPFYMGKYEVTWELYTEYLKVYNEIGKKEPPPKIPPIEKLADAVTYPTPIYELEAGPRLQRMGGRQEGYPAVIMSHFAAKQFTKWLSAKTGRFYRLPTEAEWEYAARGGTTTPYFFGDNPKQLDDYAWYFDNAKLKDGNVGYHQVGKKKPNPFGLYDIYGNAAEIVIDQYDAEHYKTLAGKTVAARDATRWPDKQYPRVVRGGGYESDPEDLRSAARVQIRKPINNSDPNEPRSPYWWTEGFSIGFRLVSPATEPRDEEKHKFWDLDNEGVREGVERDREVRQLVNELVPKK